ncbi:oxidoreductase [Oleomonas cavernae]|uniref:Oxidoreductase n=1 Tax=Oleomonas cavernae TaxID=2320859 RepID=A0A418WHA5_9PROT|nr:VOC family protein [Oleomonas cavernae]RJF89380.1 oxidoreductase [Oleomonas cavernae]
MAESLVAAVCYVRLAVQDPPASARFAAEILGLQRGVEVEGEIPFRCDQRLRSLSFLPAAQGAGSVGIELVDEAALATAEQALNAQGFTAARAGAEACRRHGVQAMAQARDGSGNAIDLVVRPLHSGRRYFPARDAGIVGLHGVGLRSRDIVRDTMFWTACLGARVSDRVGEITYLQVDSRHHRIALYPSERAGLLYAAFEVEALDNIMQSSYFAQEHQVRIIQGPGRETASNLAFLHLQGPDGALFSYVGGDDDLAGRAHRPRQFPRTVASLCAWGSTCADVPELQAPAS